MIQYEAPMVVIDFYFRGLLLYSGLLLHFSDQDDRLSYVSVPNSDYSVTTIASEMNRSRSTDYESEE